MMQCLYALYVHEYRHVHENDHGESTGQDPAIHALLGNDKIHKWWWFAYCVWSYSGIAQYSWHCPVKFNHVSQDWPSASLSLHMCPLTRLITLLVQRLVFACYEFHTGELYWLQCQPLLSLLSLACQQQLHTMPHVESCRRPATCCSDWTMASAT